ncbi:hypothetical protein AAAB34_14035, partial [Lacticaseibacillus casei]|uniref:hypothetical protein n=1 Tax=Lacticaseibacillus casei TaxID=1582 RepID=UPI0030F1BC1D
MKATLCNTSGPSRLYFALTVQLSVVTSDLDSTMVSLREMSRWVTMAMIASEDVEFYRVAGLVPKGVIRCFLSVLPGMG